MRNGQLILATVIVVTTLGIGATIGSHVTAKTRLDPAPGPQGPTTKPGMTSSR